MGNRKDTEAELSVTCGGVSCSGGSHKSWWMVLAHHSGEPPLESHT